MTRFRMTCAVLTVVLAGLAAYTTAGAGQSQQKPPGSKVRVGTFDSRALAMAYYRSDAFRRHVDGLRAEYEKAKAAGDEKRVKELEAESSDPTWADSGWPPSPARQELINEQGFGTGPVDNILERIKEKIPEIAKQAGVDVIVSKWDIVYQRPGVEFVNVIDLMVKPFNPDEATLKIIKEIQKQDPVPLEELKGHQD
jgi:hypothetical protein